MPLGMEVGLGPGDFVLDGDPAPTPPKRGWSPQIFGPCLLWPNGSMDQDGTWHGDRRQPRRLCVKWGPSPPPKFSAYVYYSYCDFVRTLHRRKVLLVCSSSSEVLVFYAFYFRKFNRTWSVRYAQLHHMAQIAEVGVAN